MTLYKEVLSLMAIMLTFVAFVPYIMSIKQGQTRPHVFSWIIWGSTTFVVFLAQLADKGGVGAWPIGVSGIITLYIAMLAYARRADISITRTDWYFFIFALTSLPLWYLTKDPLYTVVILTTVDLLGLGPTFRKAWHHPFEEPLKFYTLIAVRNFLSIMALEHLSMTTILFPASLGLGCVLFIAVIMYRRKLPLKDE